MAFDPQSAVLASASFDQTIMLWNVREKLPLERLLGVGAGRWPSYVPRERGGYFACSDDMMPQLGFQHGNIVYPAETWAAELRRPDKVAEILRQARETSHGLSTD